jgi:hypothetical protein
MTCQDIVSQTSLGSGLGLTIKVATAGFDYVAMLFYINAPGSGLVHVSLDTGFTFAAIIIPANLGGIVTLGGTGGATADGVNQVLAAVPFVPTIVQVAMAAPPSGNWIYRFLGGFFD